MSNPTYNSKGFLLPDSIRSCAMYHAKVMPSGEYFFRVHDCITGVRLRGDLTSPEERAEAIYKLRSLAAAASEMARFIENNLFTPTL